MIPFPVHPPQPRPAARAQIHSIRSSIEHERHFAGEVRDCPPRSPFYRNTTHSESFHHMLIDPIVFKAYIVIDGIDLNAH